MKGLGTRIITGIIFIIVMVGGTFLHPLSFATLFILIGIFCLWEFHTMVNTTGEKLLPKLILVAYGIIPTLALSLLVFYPETFREKGFLLFLGVFLCFMILLLGRLFSSPEKPLRYIGYANMGLLYLGIPFGLVIFLGLNNGFQPLLILGILFLTWINDSFAYLVGSQLGKNALVPRISPKKTWEGLIGGVLFTLIGGFLISLFLESPRLQDWLALAAIVTVFANFGDLFESLLKRQYKIKDSSGLLPGHGGFLDRFDGFIFALPFSLLYLLLKDV